MSAISSSRVIRFSTFEVNLHTGELRQRGQKVKLQEQPLQLLAALLERPGESVTREELRGKLWPATRSSTSIIVSMPPSRDCATLWENQRSGPSLLRLSLDEDIALSAMLRFQPRPHQPSPTSRARNQTRKPDKSQQRCCRQVPLAFGHGSGR